MATEGLDFVGIGWHLVNFLEDQWHRSGGGEGFWEESNATGRYHQSVVLGNLKNAKNRQQALWLLRVSVATQPKIHTLFGNSLMHRALWNFRVLRNLLLLAKCRGKGPNRCLAHKRIRPKKQPSRCTIYLGDLDVALLFKPVVSIQRSNEAQIEIASNAIYCCLQVVACWVASL